MRRLAIIAGLVLAGCVTPSIPIPPPDPAAMTFTLTADPGGTVTAASLSYPATDSYRGGIAYVFNRSIGRGIIESVKPDGSIGPTTPVEATIGHALVISVENEEQTVSTCITLREGGTAANYCP